MKTLLDSCSSTYSNQTRTEVHYLEFNHRHRAENPPEKLLLIVLLSPPYSALKRKYRIRRVRTSEFSHQLFSHAQLTTDRPYFWSGSRLCRIGSVLVQRISHRNILRAVSVQSVYRTSLKYQPRCHPDT